MAGEKPLGVQQPPVFKGNNVSHITYRTQNTVAKLISRAKDDIKQPILLNRSNANEDEGLYVF